MNSLIPAQKFPVRLRREFCCKPLTSLADWIQKSPQRARICKIPCYFPCYQGNLGTETGSHRTASSATQSGLPLTVLRHPGISAVARYFGGGEPVSTDGFGGFNALRGRCLQGPILTNGSSLPPPPCHGAARPRALSVQSPNHRRLRRRHQQFRPRRHVGAR